jgi:hypothetical protein
VGWTPPRSPSARGHGARLTLHSYQRPADPRTGRGGPGRWGTDERERYVLAGGTCVCDRRTAKDELTSTESGDRRV